MTKLNQWLAVEQGRKTSLNAAIDTYYKQIQRTALYSGFERVYTPIDDPENPSVETLATESQRVQLSVETGLREAVKVMAKLWDVVYTKDVANTAATGSVVVDGVTLVEEVPVTHLLFLEKQLTDLLTVLGKVPTLDPAYVWAYDAQADCWRWNEPVTTIRTQRRPQVLVKYAATDKHPAQVEVYQEDVPVGRWRKVEMSGAMSAGSVRELTSRARKLLEAVKFAREEANAMDITEMHIGETLLGYIFA